MEEVKYENFKLIFLSVFVPRNVWIFLSIKFRGFLRKFHQKGNNKNTLSQKTIITMIFTKNVLPQV